METKNKDEKILVARAKSALVQQQWGSIQSQIKSLLWRYEDKDILEQRKFIEQIQLGFDNNPHANYDAYALANINEFEFSADDMTENSLVIYNMGHAHSYRGTLYHELAHILVRKYCWAVAASHNGPHCLEFAFINYAMLWKFVPEHGKHNKCFFRAYDIHEDISYANLSISPSKFDSLVKLIEWKDFEDLANQAEKLSASIRKKLVM